MINEKEKKLNELGYTVVSRGGIDYYFLGVKCTNLGQWLWTNSGDPFSDGVTVSSEFVLKNNISAPQNMEEWENLVARYQSSLAA